MTYHKSLEDEFDVGPTPQKTEVVDVEVVEESTDSDIVLVEETPDNKISPKLSDSDFINKKLKEVIESTQSALEDSITFMRQEGDGKSMEGVAKISTAITNAAKSLIELNDKEKQNEFKLNDVGDNSNKGPQTVNNNLILSTTELLKRLSDNVDKDNKKKDDNSE
jgi:hypothetical protein